MQPRRCRTLIEVHKSFRRRPGRVLNVLCTFNLRPVSTRKFFLATFLFFSVFRYCGFIKIASSKCIERGLSKEIEKIFGLGGSVVKNCGKSLLGIFPKFADFSATIFRFNNNSNAQLTFQSHQ